MFACVFVSSLHLELNLLLGLSCRDISGNPEDTEVMGSISADLMPGHINGGA